MKARSNSINITLDEKEAFSLFETIETAEYKRVERGEKPRNLELYNTLIRHFYFEGRLNSDGEILPF